MTATLIVGVIAAVPPTLAALLAFYGTRRSDRVAVEERAATFALSLENLQATVGRVESNRVEQGASWPGWRRARLHGPRMAERRLTFAAARASDRRAAAERATVVDQSLGSLHSSVGQVADAVGRVEGVVTDLRERVARLEGARLGTAG